MLLQGIKETSETALSAELGFIFAVTQSEKMVFGLI
jgi:hypothetical protein